MPNILNIATSGLNAFQRGLEVTANNIANATTSGYSRQSLILKTLPSQRFAGGYIGSGVNAADIKRNSDRFATEQVRDTLTVKTQYDTFYQQAIQIDKLLSQDGTSISTSLNNFFNALGQLNEAPDSLSSRGVVLNQSQLMVDQFNNLQLRLDEYENNNTQQLQEAVKQINQITADIANVNGQLNAASNSPELLDRRDELLRQLAQYTNVTVVDDGNGSISVGIGSGEILVTGTDQRNLAVVNGLNGQTGTRLAIENGSNFIDVTDNLHSGMVGGLLDFQDNVITQASQLLGQMAIGMATAFNQQQNLGMDMYNLIGKNIFTDYNTSSMQLARSVPALANTGTGVLSVAISDISQTQLSDYELTVTDAATNQVRVVRKSDGQASTLTWSSSPPAPPAGQLTLDGMAITVDDTGNLADNDRFNISPTKGAARDLKQLINDPRSLAIASPVRTQSSLANTGSGKILLGDILNTNDVSKNFRIDFISDTQFNIVNLTDSTTTGPISFTPGTDNQVMIPDSLNPSYSVTLSGAPKAGDQFTASYNTDGFADNRNGLKFIDIQKGKLFEGGTESLSDRYAGLLAQVGSKTNQAKLRSDAADILNKQAIDFRESKSGVNLDEEAANLVHFQMAYQAAGQLLSVANQMIDVLFAAMR